MSTVLDYGTYSVGPTTEGQVTATSQETYRILLEKGQDGWIVVTSPDLDSVVTQGKTEKEAIRNANEVISLILEELGQNKDFNIVAFYKE